ncbi:MAG: 30S ribosomal protein S1 [Gammaproteobacteria bacterium]|tara:strand:- start:1523 stop:3196 length:1674 start_codon:yes stop_codon:yes gene_type:complete
MEQANFAKLLDESLSTLDFQIGTIITGVIVDLKSDWVTVHVGLKSEPVLARSEFLADESDKELEIGDEVKVTLEAVEDGYGETRVSRLRAMHDESWLNLEESLKTGSIVKGYITGKVRGGMTVDVAGVRAFLPGSLVDSKQLESFDHLEKTFQDFKVIKLDKDKSNVVISRKAVQEDINSEEREKLFASIEEGSTIEGIVKNLTDYGAFIDLGGIDGLLHITDITWKRINHPSEALNIGDQLSLKVTNFDKEKSRISLGLKQMYSDPWETIETLYPVNSVHKAKVSTLTDYGFFAELDKDTEGLVHVSEIDWTNKNIHPSKVVSSGDEIDVMVLELDLEKRRISLGMKQCQENPWLIFSENNSVGDTVKGTVKSITDFGMFIGLDGDIDGLVHLSDLSWTDSEENAVQSFQKGQDVQALILAMDPLKERISLGIKQLSEDPLENFIKDHPKGTPISGKISIINEDNLSITVNENILVLMRKRDFIEEESSSLEEGNEINFSISNFDRKERKIWGSMKALEKSKEKEILKENQIKNKEIEESSKSSIGDLIKEELEDK